MGMEGRGEYRGDSIDESDNTNARRYNEPLSLSDQKRLSDKADEWIRQGEEARRAKKNETPFTAEQLARPAPPGLVDVTEEFEAAAPKEDMLDAERVENSGEQSPFNAAQLERPAPPGLVDITPEYEAAKAREVETGLSEARTQIDAAFQRAYQSPE